MTQTWNIGDTVGALTVIGFGWKKNGKDRSRAAEVLCVCGTQKLVELRRLHSSSSCGCKLAETVGNANRTHGMCLSLTYKRWAAMWTRCTNPNCSSYENYKGRLPVEEWRSFPVFLADMGECPIGYSLERVDNDLPYSKENCKWIPKNLQSKNTKKSIRLLHNGVEICLADAVRIAGTKYTTTLYRLRSGKSITEILGENFSLKETQSG